MCCCHSWALVLLLFVGADGHLTAVGWFALLLGGGCRLLGAGHHLPLSVFLHVVVDWAAVVVWVSGYFVVGVA